MTEQTIKNIVEEYYSIQITNTVRKRNYVEARAIYFTLVRKYTRLSLEAIGKTVNKHHSSVLHCVRELQEWVKYDSRVRSDYEYLCSKICLFNLNMREFITLISLIIFKIMGYIQCCWITCNTFVLLILIFN